MKEAIGYIVIVLIHAVLFHIMYMQHEKAVKKHMLESHIRGKFQ